MKFGIFMAPFHRVGENPTLCFERDMQLIEWLDDLGYEEAFIGEHHSSGWETISSPEIFMAVAAARTRRIMLGSGVVSIPYHHPFHVANRFALLDHLTRGRVMLGCGPGALAGDARMLGIQTTTQRKRMVEGVKAIIRLFTEEGKISIDGSYFKLVDAHLQVKPFQQPHMPIFVASTISPSGMVAAGELGVGVLSVASYAPSGLDDLVRRWAMAEETAAEHGKSVDRKNWRLVFPIHLAETREEALNDIRAGANRWIHEYFISTLGARLQFEEYPGQPVEEMTVDRMVARGGTIIGTPDDAIAKIKELQQATGGFGGLLGLAHEWTTREKTLRSYELFARYVAPQFQGPVASQVQYSNEWAREHRDELFSNAVAGVLTAMQEYAQGKIEKGEPVPEMLTMPPTRIRP
ncbi:MAG: LLM class flavin-dependent oxidoreductase [Candidatus Binatus sp.]|uniref:LLM class flavin-dependent oxidoreductase n=1 Tax=Candidatus Binatus sp. TaxID=2811406 RepID=UPI002715DE86|nr:LLM class flavin-dependent oxidoreductase [Candidatus Binatus sp.]MDO8434477.1 LLM class flavin-dependent oxidoreductase [Candidatus Binatus sp.]